MKFTVMLPVDHVQFGAEFVGADAIREVAQGAEAAGFDALNVTDHPCPTVNWLTHGGHHAQDPFVVLAMAAAHTSRIRVQTYLLVIPYRNPFVAARSIASLDAFSGGRVIIAAGAGYLKGEFKSLGVDFDNRNALMDEGLRAMKAAWSGNEFSFEGEFFQATDSSIQPQPVQKPHPPIWIGGNSKASIRRVVDIAQGWAPMLMPAGFAKTSRTAEISNLEELAERVGMLRDYAAEQGRTDPVDLCVSPPSSMFGEGGDAAKLVDDLHRMAEIGVTWGSIHIPGDTRADWLRNAERFSKEIIEKMR